MKMTIPETNKDVNGNYIARIYGGSYTPTQLVEKNGTTYNGYIKQYKRHYLTEDGRWFDAMGFECNVPSGFDHVKKVWEVKNEAKKLKDDKKYQEYKRQMFKKGTR
jgi:hypothetical protein|tara:strand:- start:1631 stop:1948 length:318 start_codon:yes stop_codon:yes gene_type:complete